MFQPTPQLIQEDFFANTSYSKNIDCILPTSELLINFRINGLRTQKYCFVYAEKMDFKGLIQLRLTEKCDQRRMYITTVDSSAFQELKQEQSLHVTFAGFIENLVRILQDCQAGKLEINLVQMPATQSSPITGLNASVDMAVDYQLQFVEMRSFKNLIHLCLPCRLAPLNVVLFYMNNILDAMQKRTATQEHTIQQLQLDIQNHLRRNEQLDGDNCKLRENLVESTRSLNQRHAEEVQQMQEDLRKTTEQRQADNERSRKTITGLQTELEKLSTEKTTLQAEKLQEQKRIETLNEELSASKAHNATLKEQIDKLRGELAVVKNEERKFEMHLCDSRKRVVELQEKIRKYDKSHADIMAELEAEKKIAESKRQSLEIAADEINKANEIIRKQANELMKLKKTVGWRTEVALEQEKAIKEQEKVLKLRDEEVLHLRQTIEGLRLEIPQQLNSIRHFANTLETKYAEQIQALKERLKPMGKENLALRPTQSTLNKYNYK